MEVNEIRKNLQSIFHSDLTHPTFHRTLDPMDRITLALELYNESFTSLSWIGVYLISRQRAEMILGPFIGQPLDKVRYPIEGIEQSPGYWESGSEFGWNGYQKRCWVGRLVCRGELHEERDAQKNLITLIGNAIDPWWGDCDHSHPFENLPLLS
jgi:hypothetical protein